MQICMQATAACATEKCANVCGAPAGAHARPRRHRSRGEAHPQHVGWGHHAHTGVHHLSPLPYLRPVHSTSRCRRRNAPRGRPQPTADGASSRPKASRAANRAATPSPNRIEWRLAPAAAVIAALHGQNTRSTRKVRQAASSGAQTLTLVSTTLWCTRCAPPLPAAASMARDSAMRE